MIYLVGAHGPRNSQPPLSSVWRSSSRLHVYTLMQMMTTSIKCEEGGKFVLNPFSMVHLYFIFGWHGASSVSMFDSPTRVPFLIRCCSVRIGSVCLGFGPKLFGCCRKSSEDCLECLSAVKKYVLVNQNFGPPSQLTIPRFHN